MTTVAVTERAPAGLKVDVLALGTVPGDDGMAELVHRHGLAKPSTDRLASAVRTLGVKGEADEVIRWLTGYTQDQLDSHIERRTNFEDFFASAPKLNSNRSLITGTICGVRIEEIDDPLMKEVRYLDKLIDELAKGRPMEKILRK